MRKLLGLALLLVANAAVAGPGTFQFSTGAVSVNEGAGSVTLTVDRVNGADGTASIQYSTADMTAIAPGDYLQAAGTLTFADGEMSKTITIQIVDDNRSESTETFRVLLFGFSPASASIGSPGSVVVSIIDNDPPALQVNDVALSEGDSGTKSMNFTVSLPGPWTGAPFQVNAATKDGTARAGIDYGAVSSTLTFGVGDSSRTITVPIFGNTIVEPDKTFSVLISTTTGPPIRKAAGIGMILNDDYRIVPAEYELLTGATAAFRVEIGDGAPAGGAAMLVQSSNPAVLTVPQAITIPEGFNYGTIPIVAKSPGTAAISVNTLRGTALYATVYVNDPPVCSSPPRR